MPADRSYWEQKGSKKTVNIAEKLLRMINDSTAQKFKFKYNKFYIGLEKEGAVNNFISFKPKKKNTMIRIKLEKNDEIDNLIESFDLNVLEYDRQDKRYRFDIGEEESEKNYEDLKKIIKASYKYNFD